MRLMQQPSFNGYAITPQAILMPLLIIFSFIFITEGRHFHAIILLRRHYCLLFIIAYASFLR